MTSASAIFTRSTRATSCDAESRSARAAGNALHRCAHGVGRLHADAVRLLTGRYAWRTRLQEWVLACYEPPLIDGHRLTLPAFLQAARLPHGVHRQVALGLELARTAAEPDGRNSRTRLRTAEWDFSKPIRGGPTERGFDEYFGVDLPNYPPFTFIENNHVVASCPRRNTSTIRRIACSLAAAFAEARRWPRAGNSTRYCRRSPGGRFATFTSRPRQTSRSFCISR